nr:LRR-RLK-1 [Solanum microdontum subsp. gigantophyllum]
MEDQPKEVDDELLLCLLLLLPAVVGRAQANGIHVVVAVPLPLDPLLLDLVPLLPDPPLALVPLPLLFLFAVGLESFVALVTSDFRGEIPSWFGFLHQLQVVNLRSNSFTGSIPPSLSNASRLETLQISSNLLQGNIPEEIGNLHNLNWLSIENNQLTGSIPFTIFNISRIEFIAFSYNSLSGDLPNGLCSDLPILKELYLSRNKLDGEIPKDIRNLVELEEFDVGFNSFSGSLPTEMFNISALRIMSLSFNNISATLPPNIGSALPNIEELYMGRLNNLVGTIPHSISNCSKLTILDLSGIALVFVPIAIVFLWIRYRRGKRSPEQADSLSIATTERISYYELLQATDSLSESTNLIGSRTFGSVYKGVLRSGTAIAVKVFNLQLEAAFKSFDTEYIRQRLSIMIDVACSLEYLHHGCSSPVIHCDLKPSNVLLDEDMVAHLSDFETTINHRYNTLELARESEKRNGETWLRLQISGDTDGTYGCHRRTIDGITVRTAEYGLDGLVSIKCDVCSYGIMLLETLTRRKPTEFEGDLSLKQWVSYSLPEAVMDVVDANLVTPMDNRSQKELDVVASIMKVALDFCAESPARRTNMKDVVGMLQKIKIQLLAR